MWKGSSYIIMFAPVTVKRPWITWAYGSRGSNTWWRHQMETFSALLAICAGNSPVPGEFPTQRPVTRSFDIYFDLRPDKRLSKQSWGWWFETLLHSLWRHRNEDSHSKPHAPFYWLAFKFKPAWIRFHIHRKVWDEITYPFPNVNGCTVEVWELIINIISDLTMYVNTYPWWIKSNPC